MRLSILNNEATMSSIEIAELTGKRHADVKRDIENVLYQAEIDISKFANVSTNNQNQKVKFYALPKRECDLIVSGYSVKYRLKIIDRWQELENKQPALPTTTQLALMVIKAEEEKAAALIEVDRIQGVCQTITAQFAKGVTAPKFCKQLNGVNTQQVTRVLIEMGKLRHSKEGVVPVAYTRDNYFIEKQEEHNGKLRSHAEITTRGAKWLYRAYLSNKLPMKVNWDGKFNHVVFQ